MGERKGRGESRKKFPCPNNNYMLSTSKIRGVREDPFYSLQDIRIHYVHLKPCILTPSRGTYSFLHFPQVCSFSSILLASTHRPNNTTKA